MQSESVLQPALILMSGRVLGFVASFAIPVVLTRVLDPTIFGTYKQLFLVVSTLFVVAQLGMAESLYYFVPGSGAKAAHYIFNTVLVLAVAGAVCWMLLWQFRIEIGDLLGNHVVAGDMPLIGGYLLLTMVSVVLEITLTIDKQHLGASAAYGLSDFLRFVLYIVPVLLFHGLQPLLWGAVAFAAIRSIAATVILVRRYGDRFRFDSAALRTQLSYALPFALAALIGVFQRDLNQYVVAGYFDAATFAIYSIGCLQIPFVDLLMTSTSNVMMINMKEKLDAGLNEDVLWLWRDTTRKLVVAFGFIVGIFMVIAAPLFAVLFSSTYQASVPIFLVCTASTSLSALLTDAMLRVYAQVRLRIHLNVLRLIIVATLILPFIKIWGLMGAIAVTFFASAVAKWIALVKVKITMGKTWAEFLPYQEISKVLLAVIVSGALVKLAASQVEWAGIRLLLLSGVLYSIAYISCMLFFDVFTDEEKSFAKRCWRERYAVIRLVSRSSS